MGLRNTTQSYGSVMKFLHWLVATCIVIMLLIGFFYTSFGSQTTQITLIKFHKSLGLIILVLVILQLGWRLVNPCPQLPDSVPSWQQKCAYWAHILIYILIICMPISGWIMSVAAGYTPSLFCLFDAHLPIPNNHTLASVTHRIHVILPFAIIGLIILHTLAALKHHYIDKDDVLKKMLPTRKN